MMVPVLPKILVNSVPKSGTNLLLQIVLGMPGTRRRATGYYDHTFHQISEMSAADVAPAHIAYSREALAQLNQWGVKQVFIYRDLRDVIVSLDYFIMEKLHTHPLHSYFIQRQMNHQERLRVLIQGVQEPSFFYPSIYQEYRRIYDWATVPSVCAVRYEDLIQTVAQRRRAIVRIIDFLLDPYGNLYVNRTELAQRMETNINTEASWTFRQGKSGSWHSEFTEAHKTLLKEVSGDFLIRLGYEKNQNW